LSGAAERVTPRHDNPTSDLEPSVNRAQSAAVLLGSVALLLGATAALEGHDFWLVPNAFTITTGNQVEVRGQTSSRFPTSEAAVGPERVADARILSATQEARIRDLSVSGTSLRIRHRPASAGQRIVAVTLHPRAVRESAEGFRRYLVLEGAPEALERYEREGILPTDSITRRYAKYAKTLVEVGNRGPRAFSRVAGHPAEFVPLIDPSVLSAGDTLPVRLLYRGQPLSGVHVHAGSVRSASSTDEERVVTLTTDSEGTARVPIDRSGLWNVRALHVVPSDPGSGADWDTHWVTVVFGVEGSGQATPVARTPGEATDGPDSAAVAQVVHHFHAALEAADSLTALRLLKEDAIILESGAVETKQEYRTHHLPGDIAFARAVRRQAGPIRVVVRGEIAWATSTSTMRGTYRDRPVNSQSVELMVLERVAERWRIAAIHWSSRTLRPTASS
jgi:ketosteroid isomerase-like protein